MTRCCCNEKFIKISLDNRAMIEIVIFDSENYWENKLGRWQRDKAYLMEWVTEFIRLITPSRQSELISLAELISNSIPIGISTNRVHVPIIISFN